MNQASTSPIADKSVSSAATKTLAIIMVLYATSTLVSMAGMEIFGWATALGAILMLAFQKRSISEVWNTVRLPVDAALIALFAVVILGAVLKAPEGISKIDVVGSARWILLFMFLRISLYFVWSDRIAKGLVVFLMAIVAIVSVYSVWQYFYGIDLIRGSRHILEPKDYRNGQPIYRAEGLFGSSMTFGNSVVMSWCFAIAWLLHGARKSWVHKLAMATSVLGILAMFATMTRGVWLAAIAALLVMSLRSFRRGVLLLGSATVIFVVLSTFFLPELSSRLKSIGDAANSSNSARVQLWRANFEIFKENPILGIGYGVNEDVVDNYYPRLGITDGFHGHAHNTFLQFLSGTGVLGFLCFAVFTAYFLIINWRLIRSFKTAGATTTETEWPRVFIEGALGAQIAMLVGGLTECNFKDAEVNHQFILILAALATVYVTTTKRSLNRSADVRTAA